jgi:putative DNA primase/helicase
MTYEQNNLKDRPNVQDSLGFEDHRKEIFERIDYWHYEKKVNVIPANYLEKYPTTVDWKIYQTNRVLDERLEKWKKEGAFDNGFVIVLGKTYDKNNTLYLVCIDCDEKQAIDEILSIDKELNSIDSLSKIYYVEKHDDNPNSMHIYFFSPIPFLSKSKDSIIGLEVRSNEKLLIVPAPNLHPKGRQWKIKGITDPPVLTFDQAKAWLSNLDTICNKHGLSYLHQKNSEKIDRRIKKMIENFEIDKDSDYRIYEGERHPKLVSIANSILFNHLEKDDGNIGSLKRFFEEINEEFCSPKPLPPGEIESIWNSSLDYVKANKGFEIDKQNNFKNLEPEAQVGFIENATEMILDNNHFVTLKESKEILYYQNGVYVHGGEIIIEQEAERLFGYQLANKHLTEIKGHIIRRTYHERKEFDQNLDIINLQNGLYNLKENTLSPHSPDYVSVIQVPIIYDPKLRPTLFGKFLKDVLYPSEIRTALEAMAYTFYRDYPYEYYFKLFGYGSNGKSVFTALLTSLHGTKNVSNVSVKSLIDNRFALADLEFKDLNIDSEYSDGSVKDTSILKKLTGGRKQPTRIERKNQDAYDTTLYAKLIFNANSLNERIEKTNADYRREVIITFPNTFQGKDDDPQLQHKLEKQQEMSGIFNVLMIALRRILRNKGIFINEKTIDERRKKSERVADPIKSFLEDAVAENSTEADWIAKSDFHDAYKRFCKTHKIAFKPIELFAKELVKIRRFDQQKKTINGERKMGWFGIKLNPHYLIPGDQQLLSDVC